MPFAPHLRITALGRLSLSGELFSYGINLAGDGTLPSTTSSNNQDLFDDMAADVVAFHGSANTRLAAAAVLTQVKFALIGADGKYTSDPYIKDVTDTPGSVAAGTLPQTALAVSLVTERRGPTGMGRFYLPMPIVDLNPSTMLIDQTQTQQVADSAAAFLNAINDQPNVDPQPSLRVVVASSKGYNSAVTGVRVGRVVDTIQSRRRSIPEAHVLSGTAVVN